MYIYNDVFLYCVLQRPLPNSLALILSAYFREVKELFRLNQSWEKEMKLVSFLMTGAQVELCGFQQGCVQRY